MRSCVGWSSVASVGVLSVCIVGCPPIIPPMGDIVPPVQRQSLPGAWLGESTNGFGAVYRLDLYPEGRGLLGISASDVSSIASLYEIKAWRLDDRGRIAMTLRPFNSTDAPLRLKGTASIIGISLLRTEANHPEKWFKCTRMVPEAEFMKKLDHQRKRMIEVQEQMRNAAGSRTLRERPPRSDIDGVSGEEQGADLVAPGKKGDESECH